MKRHNNIGVIGRAFKAYAMMDRKKSCIGGRKAAKAIICNETGRKFNSISDAANFLGTSIPSVSNHIREKAGYEKVCGFTFKLIENT